MVMERSQEPGAMVMVYWYLPRCSFPYDGQLRLLTVATYMNGELAYANANGSVRSLQIAARSGGDSSPRYVGVYSSRFKEQAKVLLFLFGCLDFFYKKIAWRIGGCHSYPIACLLCLIAVPQYGVC